MSALPSDMENPGPAQRAARFAEVMMGGAAMADQPAEQRVDLSLQGAKRLAAAAAETGLPIEEAVAFTRLPEDLTDAEKDGFRGNVYLHHGQIHWLEGDHDEAATSFGLAYDSAARAGIPEWMIMARMAEADVLLARDNFGDTAAVRENLEDVWGLFDQEPARFANRPGKQLRGRVLRRWHDACMRDGSEAEARQVRRLGAEHGIPLLYSSKSQRDQAAWN